MKHGYHAMRVPRGKGRGIGCTVLNGASQGAGMTRSRMGPCKRQMDEQVSLGAELNKEVLVYGMEGRSQSQPRSQKARQEAPARPYLGQNREPYFGT